MLLLTFIWKNLSFYLIADTFLNNVGKFISPSMEIYDLSREILHEKILPVT